MTTQRFDTTGTDNGGDTFADDEAFGIPPEAPRSILDDLKADLKKSVKREPKVLSVPLRDGISIEYSTALDGEVLAGWRIRCTPRKGGLDKFDDLKFSCLVLANQAQDVIRRGVSTGLSFRDRELLDMLEAFGGAVDGVRKMYGSDGHVLIAASEVLEACGYGEDTGSDDDEDPTTAL